MDAASLGTIGQLVNEPISLNEISPSTTSDGEKPETAANIGQTVSGIECKWQLDILGHLFAEWFNSKN
jgi:hypothetical protein